MKNSGTFLHVLSKKIVILQPISRKVLYGIISLVKRIVHFDGFRSPHRATLRRRHSRGCLSG